MVRFRWTSPAGKEYVLPGQIAAVIQIGRLKEDPRRNFHKVRTTILEPNTNYAVVRLFCQEPKFFRKSTLAGMWYTYSVKWGKLRDGFFLLPLSTIVGTTIVVPNVEEDPNGKASADEPLDGGFFVFPSRDQLGADFLGVIVREQQDLDGMSDTDYHDRDDESSASSRSGSGDDTGSEGSTDNESDSESEEETCRRVNYLSSRFNKLDV